MTRTELELTRLVEEMLDAVKWLQVLGYANQYMLQNSLAVDPDEYDRVVEAAARSTESDSRLQAWRARLGRIYEDVDDQLGDDQLSDDQVGDDQLGDDDGAHEADERDGDDEAGWSDVGSSDVDGVAESEELDRSAPAAARGVREVVPHVTPDERAALHDADDDFGSELGAADGAAREDGPERMLDEVVRRAVSGARSGGGTAAGGRSGDGSAGRRVADRSEDDEDDHDDGGDRQRSGVGRRRKRGRRGGRKRRGARDGGATASAEPTTGDAERDKPASGKLVSRKAVPGSGASRTDDTKGTRRGGAASVRGISTEEWHGRVPGQSRRGVGRRSDGESGDGGAAEDGA